MRHDSKVKVNKALKLLGLKGLVIDFIGDLATVQARFEIGSSKALNLLVKQLLPYWCVDYLGKGPSSIALGYLVTISYFSYGKF